VTAASDEECERGAFGGTINYTDVPESASLAPLA
jgi:hypothetical protein